MGCPVLAHAAYGRREVQDEILALGGVHIMLSQCQVRTCRAATIALPWHAISKGISSP